MSRVGPGGVWRLTLPKPFFRLGVYEPEFIPRGGKHHGKGKKARSGPPQPYLPAAPSLPASPVITPSPAITSSPAVTPTPSVSGDIDVTMTDADKSAGPPAGPSQGPAGTRGSSGTAPYKPLGGLRFHKRKGPRVDEHGLISHSSSDEDEEDNDNEKSEATAKDLPKDAEQK
ncbi:hypothetical protein GLOTRDRAFT_134733 [Gloeophyllum trabeum ATCC 11539]|uniref:Uncharacterized protein n=1 Tax=Gloeophyllum trabeum (strain ATCC 11539 / FP-39264 / Madison 617) TaxID=670483 RepID=S7RBB9_GLOTA|nr:uncharacterized protein GLOTRDRAFT_134733 [Gloeophyllum trabeum ATCC 11539]EPQ49694.1 hypothetical protein GLOTRDRAFT_134733 [Gloeophyllum trabeum ATCC 11539]